MSSAAWGLPRAEDMDLTYLDTALETMLAQVNPSPGDFVQGKDVDLLVDIVRSSTSTTDFQLPDMNGLTSAYYPFSLEISMDRLLRYGYNPDLPTYLVVPNTVRRGEWTSVNAGANVLPKLWEHLGHLDTPVVVHGVEHEEITPDVFSGGYYSYDMDRALILLAHEGRPVLISVTRQQDRSAVGKKGAVVGNDGDWQYLYSGVKGLTKGGLGWVSSYMYESMSVTVFCEVPGSQGPRIKAGVFKWLRAGWAGINMVRTHHIKEGCKRFATAMTEILESPNLPPEDRLVRHIDMCKRLTPGELRGLVKPYVDELKKADDPVVNKSPFKKLLASGEYLQNMPKEDMVKVLVQGYLKDILGRDHVVDATACQQILARRTDGDHEAGSPEQGVSPNNS
ncbi:hypothetical protein DPF_1535 [Desulfoplanes formicivorans]|uniref:Uncharacterized protein n=2 Tax=Desulfoplanes formicivorans TaxID=1592317 RepID=A0A194AHL7_9BACT|nr:hypothetical protein DPF_1535 [Desulfoplanes formicivorans]